MDPLKHNIEIQRASLRNVDGYENPHLSGGQQRYVTLAGTLKTGNRASRIGKLFWTTTNEA